MLSYLKIPIIFLATLGAAIAAESSNLQVNKLPEWALGGFVRAEKNPVIKPNPESVFDCPMQKRPIKWEESDTFNPTAISHKGKIYVLYRAEDNTAQGIGSRTSRIGLAETSDGVNMKFRPAPVMYPDEDNAKEFEWTGGCEDPRVTQTEDGTFVLMYTGWNKKVARLCVATSKDLIHWQKHGPAFAKAYDGKYKNLFCKSGSVLTERSRRDPNKYVMSKVDGKYFMYWGEHRVHAATSEDLINWTPLEKDGKLLELAKPRRGFFDSALTECGPAAIRTKHGIVLLYNGKNQNGDGGDRRFKGGSYCAGQMLFDAKDPTREIARLDLPFFRPMADFERKGQYADGTVFIEGLTFHKGKWYLYYGCADSMVGLAVFDPKRPAPADPIPLN